MAAEITAFQPLRYAGYNYDSWSETYYLHARYYDPVNQDDPDGEFAQVLWGAVGGAAFFAGEQAVAGAWKARSVFKKQGFKAGMRATWANTKKSWSLKGVRRQRRYRRCHRWPGHGGGRCKSESWSADCPQGDSSKRATCAPRPQAA